MNQEQQNKAANIKIPLISIGFVFGILFLWIFAFASAVSINPDNDIWWMMATGHISTHPASAIKK